MIPLTSNDERLTNVVTTSESFVSTSVSFLLLLPLTASVTALISWLIYEWSDTVEQRMIYGSSIDGRWTNIDTHNSDICSSIPRFLQGSHACVQVCSRAYILLVYL